MQSPTYVLHTEKFLSVPCVTHEKLVGRLDALHMYNPVMSIYIIFELTLLLLN